MRLAFRIILMPLEGEEMTGHDPSRNQEGIDGHAFRDDEVRIWNYELQVTNVRQTLRKGHESGRRTRVPIHKGPPARAGQYKKNPPLARGALMQTHAPLQSRLGFVLRWLLKFSLHRNDYGNGIP